MRVDVRNGWADLGKQIDALSDTVRNKVVPRTLNKVVEGARGRMATEISAEFMITKREANENLVVRKATFKAGRFFMQAVLASPSGKRGRGFNLIRFVRGKRIVGGWNKAPLKFKIKRAGGTVSINGAFIGNQGRTVFRRVGNKRLPIESVSTIDVPQMFNTRKVSAKVVAYINERVPVVFAQELKFATRTK